MARKARSRSAVVFTDVTSSGANNTSMACNFRSGHCDIYAMYEREEQRTETERWV